MATEISIHINLTAMQAQALAAYVADNHLWLESVVIERAEAAVKDIVALEVASCLANGVQIPIAIADIVDQAFDRGTVIDLTAE